MDSIQPGERHLRLLDRSARSQNDEKVLRWLADRGPISSVDDRKRQTSIYMNLRGESMPSVLERLRRKGKVRRHWDHGQMHYASRPGVYLRPLNSVTNHLDLALRLSPLTRAEIESAERRLAAHPENIEVRRVLIETYEGLAYRKPVDRKNARRHYEHLLYLIQNAPGQRFLGYHSRAYGDEFMKSSTDARFAKLWREQVAAHPTDSNVRENAIQYFSHVQGGDAEQIVEEALAVEQRPEWYHDLGTQLARAVYDKCGQPDLAQAARALDAFETAWNLSKRRYQSDAVDVAKMAFVAGDGEKARAFARLAMEKPAHYPEWKSPDQTGIHDGNIVLGRLALREGDREAARAYLLAAGDVGSSPILCSSGPRMTLAKELLEIGERDVVLRFLARCSRFWAPELSQIPEWTRVIERGGMPDFRRLI